MGSPLAPVLACLYMEMYETEMRFSLQGPQPTLWVRYVDDILLQWSHSIEEFNAFLHNLNQLEYLINLKVEREVPDPERPGFAMILFLDLCIHCAPSGLTFSVYRKPTSTEMYTHYFSSHPHSTKRGILISLFLRAHRLCDDIHITGEIKHIRSTFLKLQYPSHVINQAMWTAKLSIGSIIL